MVQALADEGAAVAVNDIAATASDGQAFVEELQAKGVRAAFYPADVSQRAEVDALVASIQADFGGLDIVCSNAGVADWKTVAETDDASSTASSPSTSRARSTSARRQHVPWSRRARRAHHPDLVGARADGLPDDVGLRRDEVGDARAVRVDGDRARTARHPRQPHRAGLGASQLNDPSPALASEEITRANLATIPIEGRAAEPYELGRAAVYLASSDGDYVTGAYLRVDGGFVVGKY